MIARVRKVGIEEVAREAGVSTTTVSRVINQVPTVSDDNRRRVLETIKRLKYHPNPSAQSLASGRNNTIGIILPRFADMFRSYYISELLKGVGTGVERLGLNLLLHITRGKATIDYSAMEGLLFADIEGNEDQLDAAIEQDIPSVVMNNYIKELPVSCIAIDNRLAAERVVAYLAELGHREIATITGHLKTPTGLDRLDGYLKAMKERKLEVKPHFVQRGDYTAQSAKEPARRLLTHPERPTAVFAASDEMAVTAIEVAWELGLRVPEDLSVVGFDDSPMAAFARVPLTTVWQPLSQVGELAVDVLSKLISGKQRHSVKTLLATKLIERQSCRQTWLEH